MVTNATYPQAAQQFGAYGQQQSAPPVPQAQAPIPGQPFQTVDIADFRWKSLHGVMRANLAALQALIGTQFPGTEEDLSSGTLSDTDLMELESGGSDLDFEESSIETLGEIIQHSQKITAVAQRFQYLLTIRPHPEAADTEENQPQ